MTHLEILRHVMQKYFAKDADISLSGQTVPERGINSCKADDTPEGPEDDFSMRSTSRIICDLFDLGRHKSDGALFSVTRGGKRDLISAIARGYAEERKRGETDRRRLA